MAWLRLWTDILDDVDLHALPRETRWAWTTFLAAAKRFDRDGALPELKVLAHWVREPLSDVTRWVEELVTAGLIDRNGVTHSLHGWQRWQATTDRTNAKRQADWRARQKEGRTPPPEIPPLPPERRIEERRGEVTPLVTPLRNGPPSPSSILAGEPEPFDPGPPDDPPPPSDPEQDRVCRMAEEIGGDVSWATWASNRFRLGDKPTVIEAALSEAVDSQVIDLSYVGKIAARMSREGIGKPKGYGGKGKTSKPEPMTNGSGVFLMPRIYPDDKPIPADEAYRIMTGRQKGANA